MLRWVTKVSPSGRATRPLADWRVAVRPPTGSAARSARPPASGPGPRARHVRSPAVIQNWREVLTYWHLGPRPTSGLRRAKPAWTFSIAPGKGGELVVGVPQRHATRRLRWSRFAAQRATDRTGCGLPARVPVQRPAGPPGLMVTGGRPTGALLCTSSWASRTAAATESTTH